MQRKLLQNIQNMHQQTSHNEDLITRLRKRAEIRRQIPTRKSVQEGKPDRLADLLEEAANEIENLIYKMDFWKSKASIL